MKHHVAPNMHAAKWRSLRDRPLQSPCRRVHRKTFDRDFAVGDRKSTRLNSSHTVISYAVFCLKKKEKTSELQSHSHFLCGLLLEKESSATPCEFYGQWPLPNPFSPQHWPQRLPRFFVLLASR